MGNMVDLVRMNIDYVDNPYWSVMQVKVKQLDQDTQRTIGELDKGKVLLFVNMSVEDKQKLEESEQLKKLKMLGERYGDQGFGVYTIFPNDVESGNPLRNRDLAILLKNCGFYNPAVLNPHMKFLQKVKKLSTNIQSYIQMDINGNEMDNLYKFLKRNSALFSPKFGRAYRIKESYAKFLCNRYGEVKHYYNPGVEFAVIEADVRRLLEEQFNEIKYDKLLNPPDNYL